MYQKRFKLHFPAILIAALLICFVKINANAQNIPLIDKNQFFSTQKQLLEDSVQKKFIIDYPFIIGRNHTPIPSIVTHPYFDENKWVAGSLVYNNVNYKLEGLKYDIENDKLVCLLIDNKENTMSYISLDENYIREFTLKTAKFRYYTDLTNESGRKLKAGYYEVVYDGKMKFLVRKEKTKSLTDYKISTKMFLLKDGKAIGVNSMGKIQSLLNDKKEEVKKFVWDNSLRIDDTDYNSASKVLNFYENL